MKRSAGELSQLMSCDLTPLKKSQRWHFLLFHKAVNDTQNNTTQKNRQNTTDMEKTSTIVNREAGLSVPENPPKEVNLPCCKDPFA